MKAPPRLELQLQQQPQQLQLLLLLQLYLHCPLSYYFYIKNHALCFIPQHLSSHSIPLLQLLQLQLQHIYADLQQYWSKFCCAIVLQISTHCKKAYYNFLKRKKFFFKNGHFRQIWPFTTLSHIRVMVTRGHGMVRVILNSPQVRAPKNEIKKWGFFGVILVPLLSFGPF